MNEEMEDAFDKINQIRQEYFVQGLNQAKSENKSHISNKSFQEGYEKGKELGLEIGYYAAIVENLKPLVNFLIKFANRKEKIEKNIFELEKLLINFDICEKTEEENVKELLYIRAKMKILCSLCEIKIKIIEN